MNSFTLVLGGEGVTGIAWETGVIAGLADEGIDLRQAHSTLGTSAGAAVAGQLASGASIERLYEHQLTGVPYEIAKSLSAGGILKFVLAQLSPGDQQHASRRVGALTLSASITPGTVASSSPTLLNPIELRSNGDGLVVLMPRSCIDLRAGTTYRSIVVALIACNCAIVSAVANGWSRSPASASSGSHGPRITTRHFPHGRPINAHTCSNNDRESSLYSFGRSRRLSTCSAGSGNT